MKKDDFSTFKRGPQVSFASQDGFFPQGPPHFRKKTREINRLLLTTLLISRRIIQRTF